MAGLEELGLSALDVRAADAIVICVEERLMAHYHAVAERLRAAGLRVEVFPDQKKLGQQFAFAEKKGIPAAILCGEAEYAVGAVNVRNLISCARSATDETERRDQKRSQRIVDGS